MSKIKPKIYQNTSLLYTRKTCEKNIILFKN